MGPLTLWLPFIRVFPAGRRLPGSAGAAAARDFSRSRTTAGPVRHASALAHAATYGTGAQWAQPQTWADKIPVQIDEDDDGENVHILLLIVVATRGVTTYPQSCGVTGYRKERGLRRA